MMKYLYKSIFVAIAFGLIGFGAFGQNIEYARGVLDTLCSKEFFGRGYLKDGVGKSGNWIAGQMKMFDLKPMGLNGYRQVFKHPIQIFPKEPKLVINKVNYEFGVDYLFKASSCSGSGEGVEFSKIEEGKYLSSDKKVQIQFVEKPNFSSSVNVDSLITFFVQKDSIAYAEKLVVDYRLESNYISSFESFNVIGMVEGVVNPGEYLIVGAHYDHLGGVGEELYFPGANDNASGVSMLLDLAQHIKKNPLPYSVIFISFAGEEAGLLGSAHFVKNPTIDLTKVKFMLNLDLLGNGEEGIVVVNGAELPEVMRKIENWNEKYKGFNEVVKRGKAANSDHYYFYEVGVPSVFIYSKGGKGYYHDIYDIPDNMSFSKYNELFALSLYLLSEI